MPNATVAEMRRGVARVRDAFVWHGRDGLAYVTTLLALCHRAVELRGFVRSQPLLGEAGCAPIAAAVPGAGGGPRPARCASTNRRPNSMRWSWPARPPARSPCD